jgi:hypothetical protein
MEKRIECRRVFGIRETRAAEMIERRAMGRMIRGAGGLKELGVG